MTTDEDVLLREVDEELQQDKQLAFLKSYGPWLGAAAVAVLIGVGANQFLAGQREASASSAAEAYRAAVLESQESAGVTGADAMSQFGSQVDGGYRALAAFRAAGLLQASDKADEALTSLQTIYSDAGLPDRMRDLARLRAAVILLDRDVPQAGSLADEITTVALLPYAKEVKGMVAMAGEQYEEAHGIFSDLSTGLDTPAGLAGRAAVLLPLADAGRAGVALAPKESEAEAFIESFTNQLEDEGLVAPTQGSAESEDAPAALEQ